MPGLRVSDPCFHNFVLDSHAPNATMLPSLYPGLSFPSLKLGPPGPVGYSGPDLPIS
jgi:hypothetical protein